MNRYARELGYNNNFFQNINLLEIVSNSEANRSFIIARKEAREKIDRFMNLKICKNMLKDV